MNALPSPFITLTSLFMLLLTIATLQEQVQLLNATLSLFGYTLSDDLMKLELTYNTKPKMRQLKIEGIQIKQVNISFINKSHTVPEQEIVIFSCRASGFQNCWNSFISKDKIHLQLIIDQDKLNYTLIKQNNIFKLQYLHFQHLKAEKDDISEMTKKVLFFTLIIMGLVVAVISLILLIIGMIFCISRRIQNRIYTQNEQILEYNNVEKQELSKQPLNYQNQQCDLHNVQFDAKPPKLQKSKSTIRRNAMILLTKPNNFNTVIKQTKEANIKHQNTSKLSQQNNKLQSSPLFPVLDFNKSKSLKDEQIIPKTPMIIEQTSENLRNDSTIETTKFTSNNANSSVVFQGGEDSLYTQATIYQGKHLNAPAISVQHLQPSIQDLGIFGNM